MDERVWHYEQSGQNVGPFTIDELRRLLDVGIIDPDTRLRSMDGPEDAASSVLDIQDAGFAASPAEKAKETTAGPVEAELASSTPPPLPPPPPPLPSSKASSSPGVLASSQGVSDRKPQATYPWNPCVIGWLGLLFSPVWAGIMAAINSRRLQMDLPLWRPITIGIGVTILDIVVSMVIGDYFSVDLVLYLGALGLIWHLDLKPQLQDFDSSQTERGRTAGWLVPALVGSPAALLVVFTFLICPLMPLGPRDVCQEFIAMETADAARKYVTTNMYPLIEQSKRIEKLAEQLPEEGLPEVDYDMFELTDEGDAPPDIGGYLVGCRTFFPGDNGDSLLMDGYFHLTNFTGDWKIDGWYVTSVNGEPVDQGSVAMTAFWKSIADEMQKEIDSETRLARNENARKHNRSMHNYGMDAVRDATRSSSGSVSQSDDSARTDGTDQQGSRPPWQHPGLFVALKGFFVGGGAKKLGALILAALAGLAGLGRWLGRSGHKP